MPATPVRNVPSCSVMHDHHARGDSVLCTGEVPHRECTAPESTVVALTQYSCVWQKSVGMVKRKRKLYQQHMLTIEY